MPEPRRYRFGPLEPGGAIGGLGWGQVAVVAGGLGAMILTLHQGAASLRSPAGVGAGALALFFALAGAAIAFAPIGGRTLEGWAPVAAGFASRRLRGRHRHRSGAPQAGGGLGKEPPLSLPPALAGLQVIGVPMPAGEIGLVRDARGPAWTLVLAVRGGGFSLLDQAERERRLATFGSVLASFARAGTPICRLQWLERTAAPPVDEMGRYLADGLDRSLPAEHVSLRSYIAVVDDAAPAARPHELLLSLQTDARRAARALGQRRVTDAEACALLLREARAWADLNAADVRVEGALTPRMLARAIRAGFDPDRRGGGGERGRDEGPHPNLCGPMGAEESWGSYRADGYWHRTYWCAEWPRVDVTCDFLQPLLVGGTVRRAFGVVMEPVDPRRAVRQAENARTNAISDEEVRARAGFRLTARRRRQQEALARREQEIADGHGAFRFSGYLTVSARSSDELEGASAEVEQQAQKAHLALERCVGEQAACFTYTLPLCRGLR